MYVLARNTTSSGDPALPRDPRQRSREDLDQPVKDFIYARTRVASKDQGLDSNSVRSRTLISQWPVEKDAPIKPRDAVGKMTSDPITQLWGETLLDFYHFIHPRTPRYSQITTSSKCADWARSVNKTSLASQEIMWADYEDIPRKINPVVPTHLIESDNSQASLSRNSQPWLIEERRKRKLKQSQVVPPFDHSNYPSPFPLVPFSTILRPLQKQIPFYMLPKKLHIHDPDNILSMGHGQNSDMDFETVDEDGDVSMDQPSEDHNELAPDIELRKKRVKWPLGSKGIHHTYRLGVSTDARRTAHTSAPTSSDATSLNGLFLHPPVFLSATIDPPVFIAFPPRPSLQPAQEAHLYLDRSHMLGHGNHSSVCLAELELPASMLQEPEICYECAFNSVSHRLNEGDVTVGKDYHFVWDPTKEDSSSYCQVDGMVSASTATPASESGTVVVFQFAEHNRDVILQDETGKDPRDLKPGEDESIRKTTQYFRRISEARLGTRYSEVTRVRAMYAGPLRVIAADVSWWVPGVTRPCQHQQARKLLPSIKFAVAAKLSLPGDVHLAREAQAYQRFPSHFFEHWTGYQVIPPSHDPVPCGAIAPQFYGHYQPPSSSTSQYLSPILLLEHCGKQVDPSEMDMDDRQECASLAFRMHNGGWVQQSIAQRNFVVQDEAPPDIQEDSACGAIPRDRTKKRKSFRLIDFGRAKKFEGSFSRPNEENFARDLFKTQEEFLLTPVS